MTQDEYTVWTGLAINFTDETWTQIVNVAMLRLASFLCRESLPTDDQGNLPDALKMLLANFIAGVFKYCPRACGIFPDQGPNPRPWHWQADS